MKTAQLLFNLEMGIPPTDEEFNALYSAHKEIFAVIDAWPKKSFTLTKADKADRTIMARCPAEIEANPANRGWTIAS